MDCCAYIRSQSTVAGFLVIVIRRRVTVDDRYKRSDRQDVRTVSVSDAKQTSYAVCGQFNCDLI